MQGPTVPTQLSRVLLLGIAVTLGGCYNHADTETTFSLGGVSIGQQLVDLEAARNAKLLSDAEARLLRNRLIDAILQIDLEAGETADEPAAHTSTSEQLKMAEEQAEKGDRFRWF